jgi:hypothetical protein
MEHTWARHGAFMACTECGRIQLPNPSPCPGRKPRGPAIPCVICKLPLTGNDLDCYHESQGDLQTHLCCI